ncbi:MAG: CocE/NonD family hydrolase [Bacteroidota bacterium]
MSKRFSAYSISLLCIMILLVKFARPLSAGGEARISRPGVYQGYSRRLYPGWKRSSQYVTVRDGTKLAVDIFRPAVKGRPVTEPLPVIWTQTRYGRRMRFLWGSYDILRQFPWLRTVVKHGYIIAAVDTRGTGASFGIWRLANSPEEARDAYDLTEWFAARPWCNGRVGMFGRSYLGNTQYMAASKAPPHLLAIFPEMGGGDVYEMAYPGGVLRSGFLGIWSRYLNYLDTRAAPARVDEDPRGEMARAAQREHAGNTNTAAEARLYPYRDDVQRSTGLQPFLTSNVHRYFKEIGASGVAIYQYAGWFDGYPRGALLCQENLANPRKLIIGPWHHMGGKGFDLAAEHLRWYDYWLKGIDNGIMREAPIRYYVMDAPKGMEWRTARQWPPPNQRLTKFYLGPGRTGSVDSCNDGFLSAAAPAAATGRDEYKVDYTATSGKTSRWINMAAGRYYYPDMAGNDRKGLTYTTPPLTRAVEVTGSPIMHLWVSSTARDGDFFAYLEEVDEYGRSRYVTEGVLRASHRALAAPPDNHLGLPYHRSYAGDTVELPGPAPVELVFDLLPTAKVFKKGHRIRLTITCADKDNAQTPVLSPAPTVSVYRQSGRASYLELPVIIGGKGGTADYFR